MTAPGLSEQELAEIDLAVGQVEHLDVKYNTYQGRIRVIRTIIYDPPDPIIGKFDECVYQPTRDPAEGMRLLTKHEIGLNPPSDIPGFCTWGWEASYWLDKQAGHRDWEIGPTPCIAICRAVIALGAPK